MTIDPLEGTPDADANLPFGTIFSIAPVSDAPWQGKTPPVAGFIHYGPQTNLVLTLGAGDITTVGPDVLQRLQSCAVAR